MKKEATAIDAQLLALLKKVLPKATTDLAMANKILAAVQEELQLKKRGAAFEKFCQRVELPNLEAPHIKQVEQQLAATFSEGEVSVIPQPDFNRVDVEVALPDGTQFTSQIVVNSGAAESSEEQEIVLKFVPFPVAMPGDQELVWVLAKRENMNGDEARIALAKIEEEFWASKTGQKLIRDRVEKSFPEFVARVPAGMLNERGLKRHYKTPEALEILRPLQVQ